MGNSLVCECSACQSVQEDNHHLPVQGLTFHDENCYQLAEVSVMRSDAHSETPEFPTLISNLAIVKAGLVKASTIGQVSAPPGHEDNTIGIAPEDSPKVWRKPWKKTVTFAREAIPCLELVFDVEGQVKTVEFYKQPLGAEFSKRCSGLDQPVTVTKVRPASYASEVGLEVGWVLKAINGEATYGKKLDEVQTLIKKQVQSLPGCQ